MDRPMSVARPTWAGPLATRRKLILGLAVSVLFHFLFLSLFRLKDAYQGGLGQELETIPREVAVSFPENNPKQIVENVNSNRETPDKSDLLSEKSSRARNETLLEQRQNQPSSEGNTAFANLSRSGSLAQDSYVRRSNAAKAGKFTRSALLGNQGYRPADNRQGDAFTPADGEAYLGESGGTDNLYDQTEFSADGLGSLTLSTYAWEWASYINDFKRKLYEVWRTPPAYFSLGLIHGRTVIHLVIDRKGGMVSSRVLEHQGHSSLQVSSENAVRDVFPLPPLPPDFPDQTLTLTLTLVYPDLRGKE